MSPSDALAVFTDAVAQSGGFLTAVFVFAAAFKVVKVAMRILQGRF